ncbi:formate dehydrogenase subunit delta [Saccharopolyspora sp. NPDC000995]
MSTSPVMKMADDIAAQFRHYPPRAAAASIANHIRQFWEPRMRSQLAAKVAEDGADCDPNVVAAVKLLGGR